MTTQAAEITADVVEAHGLSPEEYERVLHALGREPNLVELGIFSVMWSEHCSYKSSRLHLKKLPTEAPWVICGPGENAGERDGEKPLSRHRTLVAVRQDRRVKCHRSLSDEKHLLYFSLLRTHNQRHVRG